VSPGEDPALRDAGEGARLAAKRRTSAEVWWAEGRRAPYLVAAFYATAHR
jgi:hypothetical protein